jgi:hypothetical protein
LIFFFILLIFKWKYCNGNSQIYSQLIFKFPSLLYFIFLAFVLWNLCVPQIMNTLMFVFVSVPCELNCCELVLESSKLYLKFYHSEISKFLLAYCSFI